MWENYLLIKSNASLWLNLLSKFHASKFCEKNRESEPKALRPYREIIGIFSPDLVISEPLALKFVNFGGEYTQRSELQQTAQKTTFVDLLTNL